jgi:DNA-binding transcriptional LysR family regulator
MEIRQLRYFISVAEHLNFTEAANQLFVGQSAVSQQIALLEERLGVSLFIRNKRSVKLTNTGFVFLKQAIEIVKKSEEAVEIARKAEAGVIGKLRIGFLAAPVRHFLPDLIRKFNAKYPQIEINLNHIHLGQLHDRLLHDELDIIFTISMGFQETEDVEKISLFTESTVVFLHNEHPLSNKSSIRIQELSNESFAMRDREESPQWYDYALTLCIKGGFSPKIITQSRRIETVMMFVDAGLGITILPRYLEMYTTPTIRHIEIEGQQDVIDIVAYRKRSNHNPAIVLFLEELSACFSERRSAT